MQNTSKTRLSHIWRKWYRSGAVANAEILTFSTKQLFCLVDNMEKWDEDSTHTRVYYDGKEFTSRCWATSKEENPWEDSEIVFIGIIDESKITYENVPQYELYCELRDELSEKEEDLLDFLEMNETNIPSGFPGRVKQFLEGTGDW